MRRPEGSSCICGHAHEAHEHYRSGHDCGSCARGGCTRYRTAGGVVVSVLRLFRRTRSPLDHAPRFQTVRLATC